MPKQRIAPMPHDCAAELYRRRDLSLTHPTVERCPIDTKQLRGFGGREERGSALDSFHHVLLSFGAR
jgi:hypothetical protein